MGQIFKIRGLSQHVPISAEVRRRVEAQVLCVHIKDVVDEHGLRLFSAAAVVERMHASTDEEANHVEIEFLRCGNGNTARVMLEAGVAELVASPKMDCVFLVRKDPHDRTKSLHRES